MKRDYSNLNLKQLRELRAEALEKMQELNVLAQNEKRNLTPQEELEFDRAERDIALIDPYISEKLEQEETAIRALNNGAGIPATSGIHGTQAAVTTEWRDSRTGKPVEVLQRNQKFTDSLSREDKNMSIGRIIRGMVIGDFSDCSEAEKRALGSGPSSAGITVPHVLMANILDMARQQSVVMRAGASTVGMTSNNMTIAKVSQDPTMQWKAENALFNKSDMAFEPIELNAKTVGTIIPLSRELASDASNIVQVIEQTMAKALAAEIDRVALEGTGTDNQPLGLINHPGIITNAATGSITDWNKIVDAWVQILGNSGDPNAYLISPAMAGRLETLTAASDGQYLRAPESIAKLQRLITPTATSNAAVMGDFSKLLFGIRQGALLELTDKAGDSFERHQVWIKITWRGDVAVTEPGHFALLNGITL